MAQPVFLLQLNWVFLLPIFSCIYKIYLVSLLILKRIELINSIIIIFYSLQRLYNLFQRWLRSTLYQLIVLQFMWNILIFLSLLQLSSSSMVNTWKLIMGRFDDKQTKYLFWISLVIAWLEVFILVAGVSYHAIQQQQQLITNQHQSNNQVINQPPISKLPLKLPKQLRVLWRNNYTLLRLEHHWTKVFF